MSFAVCLFPVLKKQTTFINIWHPEAGLVSVHMQTDKKYIRLYKSSEKLEFRLAWPVRFWAMVVVTVVYRLLSADSVDA